MKNSSITGTWENPAASRCDPKRAYTKASSATIAAEKASKRTGELIIAYQCPDCGSYHIGHADLAQRLAREVHVDLPCQYCGGVIPEFKKEKAARFGSKALYCSDACQSHAANARTRDRKAATFSPTKSDGK